MKKLFLFGLGSLISLLSYAELAVPLLPNLDDPDIPDVPHKGTVSLPQMSYDAPYLHIVSSSAINGAEIIIRDIDGNIIYDEILCIPASSYVIVLPENICSDFYSVTLIFDGQSYILYNTL